MASSDADLLKEILSRLDKMEKAQRENAFLSKFDSMFSVLVSITIFAAGLMLNYYRTIRTASEFALPFSVAVLVILVFTLFGELWAIITNNAVMRFKYWVVLIIGFFLLISEMVIIVFPLAPPLFLGLAFIWLVWKIDSLYLAYTRRLCFRKIPAIGVNLWGPALFSLFMVGASFVATFLLVHFKII